MPQTDFQLAHLALALPEIYLTLMICVVLMVDVFAGPKRRGLSATFTQFVLVVGAALTAFVSQPAQRSVIFDGLYVADELSWVLKLAGFLFVAFGAAVLAFVSRAPRHPEGRVLRARADGAAGRVRACVCQQPADGVRRRGAAGAVGLRDGRVRSRHRASLPNPP